jgi:hypothetical protein
MYVQKDRGVRERSGAFEETSKTSRVVEGYRKVSKGIEGYRGRIEGVSKGIEGYTERRQ